MERVKNGRWDSGPKSFYFDPFLFFGLEPWIAVCMPAHLDGPCLGRLTEMRRLVVEPLADLHLDSAPGGPQACLTARGGGRCRSC